MSKHREAFGTKHKKALTEVFQMRENTKMSEFGIFMANYRGFYFCLGLMLF